MPVMVALCMAWTDGDSFKWVPAVLCLLFALIMQIDANLVNDYFDCVKGVDREDRLGPERACAQGWVTLPAMKIAIAITTIVACLVGLPLIYWGGMEMIGVGIACVIFCFLYTTLLSRKGMGDVLVLLFFGLVPVCATYYIQTQTLNAGIICMAVACGLVTDCLLIVNNYRDRDTDRRVGKHTLVTLIGPKATEWLYLWLGIIAVILSTIPLEGQMALMGLWLFLHYGTWKQMRRIHQGRELNKVLGNTARNIMTFGLSFCIILIIKQIITQ